MVEKANKISKGISCIDETLNASDSQHCLLFLQAGLDGFAFCVVDGRNNKYMGLETYTFQNTYNYQALCENIKTIIAENKYLLHEFKKVQLALVNNKSTLIPVPIFEPGHKQDYIKFNYELNQDERIETDNLKNLDVINLYALPLCLEETMKKLFVNIEFIHHSTSLLENLLLNYKNQNDKKVFVHIQLSHFEITVLEGKNLIFYNSFRHQTSEDFLYYLLFVCEQLKLNPETLQLILIGEVDRNSAIYNILQKYVRHIKFAARNDNFEYSYKFNEIPKHFYYNLCGQYLCA